MNRRKLLSIFLSLTLVFSMTTAFTFSVYAGEANDTAQNNDSIVQSSQSSQIVTPDSIMINGQELSVGQYYTGNRTTYIRPLGNYAHYKMDLSGKKRLVLYGMTLTGTEGNSAISVGDQSAGTNTLYIDLYGESTITMADKNQAPTIDAGSCSLVISAISNSAALKLKSNDGTYGTSKEEAKPTHCISAGSFTLSGGKLKIMAGTGSNITYNPYTCEGDSAIYTSNGDVIISGGSLDITGAAVGINSAACAYFTGGNTTIEQTDSTKKSLIGVYAPNDSIIVNGGNISIKKVDDFGLKAGNSIFVKKGQVSISDLGDTAISADKTAINISGGNVTIDGVTAGIASTKGNINFSGGDVTITSTRGDAVYAMDGDITLSRGSVTIGDSSKASPNIKTSGMNSYGKTNISGGFLTINSVDLSAVVANNGMTVSGGEITIEKAWKGIDIVGPVILEGGKIVIKDIDLYGLYAYSYGGDEAKSPISINGGQLTLENIGDLGMQATGTIDIKNNSTISLKNIGKEGIKAGQEISINSSTLTIEKTGKEGIKTSKDISVDSSTLSLENIGDSGIETKTNIAIKDSALTLNTIGDHGILATENINIDSSNLTLKGINKDSERRLAAIYAIGGSTTIKDTEITVDNAFDAIVSNLDISVENSRLSFDNLDNCGFFSNSPVKINNSALNIAKALHGIYSSNGTIDFSNSEGSITAFLYGMYGSGGVTVKDSDLEVVSTCEDSKYNAFSPTVTVSGTPAVYAGASKYKAKRATADSELGTYKYVHIYKTANVGLTRISAAITDLFTALVGTGSKLFGTSSLWKTLMSIIAK